jgi:hypothetical protein
MIWSIDDGASKRPEGVDEDGVPDPAYAASLGLVAAPLGRRAASTLIEAAVYALLALPLVIGASPRIVSLLSGATSWYGFLNHPDLVVTIVCAAASVVLTLVFTIVQLILHGRKGVTLGKALTGLRTVNVATLASPGFGRALLRMVVLGASSIVPVVGPVLSTGSDAAGGSTSSAARGSSTPHAGSTPTTSSACGSRARPSQPTPWASSLSCPRSRRPCSTAPRRSTSRERA